jgi:hypothetical protein
MIDRIDIDKFANLMTDYSRIGKLALTLNTVIDHLNTDNCHYHAERMKI